jgi:hypothetical protein
MPHQGRNMNAAALGGNLQKQMKVLAEFTICKHKSSVVFISLRYFVDELHFSNRCTQDANYF